MNPKETILIKQARAQWPWSKLLRSKFYSRKSAIGDSINIEWLLCCGS
jgi:hypothetical protein